MIFIKRSTKIFFRTVYISSVICFCLGIGAFGVAKAYENTLSIGFGEYKNAVEYNNGILRILDFELDLF